MTRDFLPGLHGRFGSREGTIGYELFLRHRASEALTQCWEPSGLDKWAERMGYGVVVPAAYGYSRIRRGRR
ncbi:uncharacterized protein MICPUCDRAFT_52077 [Micromonas pusilla CCMP1545]|jgi:hypothetical protein|uniref:Predicted protein n=1 Tax=Micromonas pusilla (strain CCMP1545) TaxID=564608 RepID=C1N386_MICPC|nr:uncharacterized protein MICPUCDRAFT_52077 [Micromonas pusilla CCMP1545]EEH53155.1 predicted protein [Micromonas pusilla CCMP1545]|eukprot:XP_003062336.1 predicted protein [Micromonas pusilla CCMP1545]